jgi:hypothetical protein
VLNSWNQRRLGHRLRSERPVPSDELVSRLAQSCGSAVPAKVAATRSWRPVAAIAASIALLSALAVGGAFSHPSAPAVQSVERAFGVPAGAAGNDAFRAALDTYPPPTCTWTQNPSNRKFTVTVTTQDLVTPVTVVITDQTTSSTFEQGGPTVPSTGTVTFFGDSSTHPKSGDTYSATATQGPGVLYTVNCTPATFTG